MSVLMTLKRVQNYYANTYRNVYLPQPPIYPQHSFAPTGNIIFHVGRTVVVGPGVHAGEQIKKSADYATTSS